MSSSQAVADIQTLSRQMLDGEAKGTSIRENIRGGRCKDLLNPQTTKNRIVNRCISRFKFKNDYYHSLNTTRASASYYFKVRRRILRYQHHLPQAPEGLFAGTVVCHCILEVHILLSQRHLGLKNAERKLTIINPPGEKASEKRVRDRP